MLDCLGKFGEFVWKLPTISKSNKPSQEAGVSAVFKKIEDIMQNPSKITYLFVKPGKLLIEKKKYFPY